MHASVAEASLRHASAQPRSADCLLPRSVLRSCRDGQVTFVCSALHICVRAHTHTPARTLALALWRRDVIGDVVGAIIPPGSTPIEYAQDTKKKYFEYGGLYITTTRFPALNFGMRVRTSGWGVTGRDKRRAGGGGGSRSGGGGDSGALLAVGKLGCCETKQRKQRL